MERLFITGGTGYLGRALIRQAIQMGYIVGASFFSTSPSIRQETPALSWYPLDIRDRQAITTTFAAFQPSVIIHTAYRQDGPDLQAVTTMGARLVAEEAEEVGARLLHLSSDVIFSGHRAIPYTESDTPDPVTMYGVAKAEAEQQVFATCPQAAIIRTSLMYGFDPPDRHTQFVLDIVDGKRTEQLFYDEYRCPIMVDDLASALLELVMIPYEGVINIAGSERVSRYEFGVLLASWYGRNPDGIGKASVHTCPTPRPRDCALDIGLAQQVLKTRLRGIREVLDSKVHTEGK